MSFSPPVPFPNPFILLEENEFPFFPLIVFFKESCEKIVHKNPSETTPTRIYKAIKFSLLSKRIPTTNDITTATSDPINWRNPQEWASLIGKETSAANA